MRNEWTTPVKKDRAGEGGDWGKLTPLVISIRSPSFLHNLRVDKSNKAGKRKQVTKATLLTLPCFNMSVRNFLLVHRTTWITFTCTNTYTEVFLAIWTRRSCRYLGLLVCKSSRENFPPLSRGNGYLRVKRTMLVWDLPVANRNPVPVQHLQRKVSDISRSEHSIARLHVLQDEAKKCSARWLARAWLAAITQARSSQARSR